MTIDPASNTSDTPPANIRDIMYPNDDVKDPRTYANFIRLWGRASVLDHPRTMVFLAIVEFSFAIMFVARGDWMNILLWIVGGFASYVAVVNTKRWREFIDANFPPKTSIKEVISLRKKIVAGFDNNSVS